MKKLNLYILPLLALAFILTACNKDDNPKPTPNPGGSTYFITAAVVSGASYNDRVDSVYAILPMSGKEDIILAGVEYKDGGFSMNLLDTIPDSYLKDIIDLYVFDKATISDSTAKATVEPVRFLAYKGGQAVGEFVHSGDRGDGVLENAKYLYADKPVEIFASKGIYDKEIHRYNVVYRRGWNIGRSFYMKENGIDVYEYEMNNLFGLSWHFTR